MFTPFSVTPQDEVTDKPIEPETPMATVGKLAFQSGWEQTPVGALVKAATLEYGKTGQMESPESLNKQYPFMPEPFSTETDAGKAAVMADRYLKQVEREKLIAQGPDTTAAKVGTFVAQMVPHALDPLNYAASLGVSNVLGKAALVGNLTKAAAARGVVAGAAAKYGVMATDMFLGNIPGEMLAQAEMAREKQGGSIEDALVNSVIGAGFGVGLHAGISGGVASLKSLGRYLRGKKVERLVMESSIAQAMDGKRPNVEPIVEAMVQETGHKYAGYEHQPIVNGEIPGGVLYAASEDIHGDFNNLKPLPAGQVDFGDDFLHFTDSPHVANGEAGSNFKDVEGSVVTVKPSELKLADMDNLPEDWVGLTKQDLLDDDGAMLPVFKGWLEQNGYDGFHYKVDELAGHPHSPHNAVVLLNKNKLAHEVSERANRTKIKAFTQEEAIAKAKQAEIAEEQARPLAEVNQEESKLFDDVDAFDKYLDEQIKELGEDIDPEIKAEFDAINKIDKETEDTASLFKQAAGCLLGLVGGGG